MSNLIYPAQIKGLTYTVVKTPEFATLVQTSANGDELRLAQQQNPIWHFTLVYDYLYDNYRSPNNTQAYAPYTDLQTLMGFFLARQGQNDDFLFTDPTDCAVGPALRSGTPNAQAQLAVVTNGTTYYSPIQRNLGGFFEDITDLNGALTVYANGVLQTLGTNYTVGGPGLALPGLSYRGLYLRWATQPAGPVTAQFQFYFRVRLETDSQDFENWAAGLWTIGGSQARNGSGTLKLRSARQLPAFSVP